MTTPLEQAISRDATELQPPHPRFAPVILAGGSGTRFWPRSRRSRAKQVLALDGDRTMIQQTLDRLLPLAAPQDIWVITNDLLFPEIANQLPTLEPEHILREPAARNTAPACALAAFLLEKNEPETVIGIFPSDHVVSHPDRFTEVIRAGIRIAATGKRIVVLGVPPTRPETGYGYIEAGAPAPDVYPDAYPDLYPDLASSLYPNLQPRRVRRFTEKPDLTRAQHFLSSGNYTWNSGIFLWSAQTLAGAIREFCPDMAPLLEQIAVAHGTPRFDEVFAALYPLCQNISIDYAVLEPRSAQGEAVAEIFCLPADFGWNDLGSWAALYEHQHTHAGSPPSSNITEAAQTVSIDALGNYAYAPGRTVALLGVEDLVVVVTDDAVLVTTRARSQEVGQLTRALAESGRTDLL